MAAGIRAALRRLARAIQQDRIRASPEELALLRLGPGDWVTIAEEDFVVRAATLVRSGPRPRVEYTLAPGGRDPGAAPASRLVVPLFAPDRAEVQGPDGRVLRIAPGGLIAFPGSAASAAQLSMGAAPSLPVAWAPPGNGAPPRE